VSEFVVAYFEVVVVLIFAAICLRWLRAFAERFF
jgi:hypothetical protein